MKSVMANAWMIGGMGLVAGVFLSGLVYLVWHRLNRKPHDTQINSTRENNLAGDTQSGLKRHLKEMSMAHAATLNMMEDAEEARKQLEQAHELLAEKSMYLDNILRSATEYAIATTDLGLRITYYNPMAEKIFGHTAEEVIGKTVQEIHIMEHVEPERLDKAIENVHRHGVHSYTVEQNTDKGTRILDSRVSGIRNADGELVGYALFSHDVTEMKQREADILRLSDENSKLAQEMILAQELERSTIARELHDELGQSLTLIKTELSRASKHSGDKTAVDESLQITNSVTDHIIKVTRSMLNRIQPVILDSMGLQAALEEQMRLLTDIGMECSLIIGDLPEDIDEKTRLVIYRITQECLTNIIKHARASHVTIRLDCLLEKTKDQQNTSSLMVTVEDDGVGFDNNTPDSHSMGLVGMRERVHAAGGSFDVQSTPGEGTRISVELPITHVKEDSHEQA